MSSTDTRMQCRHVLLSGLRCGSPALQKEYFCYYHHSTRKPVENLRERRAHQSTFVLPALEDRTSIQLALGEILARIADHTLDTKRAGLLLQTLQVAKSNLSASHRELMRAAESETEPDAPSPDFPDLSELLAILSPHPTPTAPLL